MLIYVNINEKKLTRGEVGKEKGRFSALKGTIFLVFFFLSLFKHEAQNTGSNFQFEGDKSHVQKTRSGILTVFQSKRSRETFCIWRLHRRQTRGHPKTLLSPQSSGPAQLALWGPGFQLHKCNASCTGWRACDFNFITESPLSQSEIGKARFSL